MFTVRWILDHVLTHEAHHQGQIALVRGLLGAPPALRVDDVHPHEEGTG
jgi:uncharacterized damage-inducible protein DinB